MIVLSAACGSGDDIAIELPAGIAPAHLAKPLVMMTYNTKNVDPYWHVYSAPEDGRDGEDANDRSWMSRLRRATATIMRESVTTILDWEGSRQPPDIIAVQEYVHSYEPCRFEICDDEGEWHQQGTGLCNYHVTPHVPEGRYLEVLVNELNAQTQDAEYAIAARSAITYDGTHCPWTDKETVEGQALIYNTRRLAPFEGFTGADCANNVILGGDSPTFCLNALDKNVGVGARLRIRRRDDNDQIIADNMSVTEDNVRAELADNWFITAFSVHLPYKPEDREDYADELTFRDSGDYGAYALGSALRFLTDVYWPRLRQLGDPDFPPVLMGDFNLNNALMLHPAVQAAIPGIGSMKVFMPPVMFAPDGTMLLQDDGVTPMPLMNFPDGVPGEPIPGIEEPEGAPEVTYNASRCVTHPHDNGHRQAQYIEAVTRYLRAYPCSQLPSVTRAIIGEETCQRIEAASCTILPDTIPMPPDEILMDCSELTQFDWFEPWMTDHACACGDRDAIIDSLERGGILFEGIQGTIDHIKIGLPELTQDWTFGAGLIRVGYWSSPCHQDKWRERSMQEVWGVDSNDHPIVSFSDHPIIIESVLPTMWVEAP